MGLSVGGRARHTLFALSTSGKCAVAAFSTAAANHVITQSPSFSLLAPHDAPLLLTSVALEHRALHRPEARLLQHPSVLAPSNGPRTEGSGKGSKCDCEQSLTRKRSRHLDHANADPGEAPQQCSVDVPHVGSTPQRGLDGSSGRQH